MLADLRGQGLAWADIAARLGGTAHARCVQLSRALERVTRELDLDKHGHEERKGKTDAAEIRDELKRRKRSPVALEGEVGVHSPVQADRIDTTNGHRFLPSQRRQAGVTPSSPRP